MSIFDKMLDVMNLSDDDEEEEFLDEAAEETAEAAAAPAPFKRPAKAKEERPARSPKGVSTPKITPMRAGSGKRQAKAASSGGGNAMEVCVIKPSAFEDVREITDTLLSERTVILNMEGLDMALAQRIIDFVSGACYAIEGNLQKVANFIFVLTPRSVDISGDMQGIMNAFDISGIQTGF